MDLEVGQIYRDRRDLDLYVVVLDVRNEGHPRGLGKPYGTSALAWPVDRLDVFYGRPHPGDTTILCGSLPHHGDEVWKLSGRMRVIVNDDGTITRED